MGLESFERELKLRSVTDPLQCGVGQALGIQQLFRLILLGPILTFIMDKHIFAAILSLTFG